MVILQSKKVQSMDQIIQVDHETKFMKRLATRDCFWRRHVVSPADFSSTAQRKRDEFWQDQRWPRCYKST